jgi:hypothetical protein
MFPLENDNNREDQVISQEKVNEIFSDFESKGNIVGLYDLLLKIAKRNPKLWAEINEQTND